MLTKEGNSLVYTKADGNIIKKFRKAWERNDEGCLDEVMLNFNEDKNNESELNNVSDEEEVDTE